MKDWEILLEKIYKASDRNIQNLPIKEIEKEWDKGKNDFYENFNLLKDLGYVEYKQPTYMNKAEIRLTKEGLSYCKETLIKK